MFFYSTAKALEALAAAAVADAKAVAAQADATTALADAASALSAAAIKLTYVDRGDPADYDFIHTDLNTDGNWHELSLVGKVPLAAKAVIISVTMRSSTVTASLAFRKVGQTNAYNMTHQVTQVTNKNIMGLFVIPLTGSAIIEYRADNVTWTFLRSVINGWLVEA